MLKTAFHLLAVAGNPGRRLISTGVVANAPSHARVAVWIGGSRAENNPDTGLAEIAKPAAGKLGVRAAQLAEDEDEQLDIPPQADAARLLLVAVVHSHLGSGPKTVSSKGEAQTPWRSLPGT